MAQKLNLLNLNHVQILDKLQDDMNAKLKGPERDKFLRYYGWVLIKVRPDGKTKDWSLPGYVYGRYNRHYVLNAGQAIRNQVYFNLVRAGLITLNGKQVLDDYINQEAKQKYFQSEKTDEFYRLNPDWKKSF